MATSMISLGRKCCDKTDIEDGVGGVTAGGDEQDYFKLMSKLIRRYIDDQDEFADMDAALRIKFERLTKEMNELKADVRSGLEEIKNR